MSYHFPSTDFPTQRQEGPADDPPVSSSEDEDDDDQNWEDWVSDSIRKAGCKSLFDDKTLQNAEDAIKYDKNAHGFDLSAACERLKLDTHGRIRLINFIRKTKATPQNVASLTGNESFFASDDYLIPCIEDDLLLQIQSDDWSDSEEEVSADVDPARRIHQLQSKLARAKEDFDAYRAMIAQKIDFASLLDTSDDAGPSGNAPPRDDDKQYFESYGENDIHAVMLQDRVRTSTYASFILTNPGVFRHATVLDVGCGTGILSLFAAKAGAARVFAVDASETIAERARKIVELNGLEDVITVICGKIEDVELPFDADDPKAGKVDVIISEWMGYALLYESMLDSVLRARDRFLSTGGEGIIAPSQCRMMLGLCDASEIVKERVTYWNDVYGFDLSPMATDVYDGAIIDVVGPNALLSEPAVVRDLHLASITPEHLDFASPFTLVSTTDRRSKVHAFLLYFDTFFSPSGNPIPSDTEATTVKEGDVELAEVWPVGGKPAQRRASQGGRRSLSRPREEEGEQKEKITSFSTGPQSIPTHWKQTLFLLREPITVHEGTTVEGSFHCRKSSTNSRELDVEIHYNVRPPGGVPGDTVIQVFRVR